MSKPNLEELQNIIDDGGLLTQGSFEDLLEMMSVGAEFTALIDYTKKLERQLERVAVAARVISEMLEDCSICSDILPDLDACLPTLDDALDALKDGAE